MTDPGQPWVMISGSAFSCGDDVDEVDVLAVDLGRELRQRVQPRLDSAPVVVGRPVPRELLDRRQLDALRAIRDELPGGPARRGDAPSKVGQRVLRNVDMERADALRLGCALKGAVQT